jgi:hypothetical protein
MGFELVIGFIENLEIVTTSNYSAIAISHSAIHYSTRLKSSQSVIFTSYLVTASTMSSASVLIFLRAGDCPPTVDSLLNSTQLNRAPLHSTPFHCTALTKYTQLGRWSDIASERTT